MPAQPRSRPPARPSRLYISWSSESARGHYSLGKVGQTIALRGLSLLAKTKEQWCWSSAGRVAVEASVADGASLTDDASDRPSHWPRLRRRRAGASHET